MTKKTLRLTAHVVLQDVDSSYLYVTRQKEAIKVVDVLEVKLRVGMDCVNAKMEKYVHMCYTYKRIIICLNWRKELHWATKI